LESFLLAVNAWMAVPEGAGLADLGLPLAGAFLWGLVSVLFSPCHLASVPLMMGYVAGQGRLVEGREAVGYALVFTSGLFVTIALVGVLCALLGRMLGDVGAYGTVLVGAVLVWVALDMLGLGMLGLGKGSLSGGLLSRFTLRGVPGALALGLGYGLLSGTCTFGFLAPLLAVITLQGQLFSGALLISAFALGHCLPIVLAGSSAALARRMLEGLSGPSGGGSLWVRRLAGSGVGLLGVYFVLRPFIAA